jgi:hypothetical protein
MAMNLSFDIDAEYWSIINDANAIIEMAELAADMEEDMFQNVSNVVVDVPVAVDEEDSEDFGDCCSICFNPFEKNKVNTCTTSCGHCFHTGCLLQNGQYRSECPMCRHVLIEPKRKSRAEPEPVEQGEDRRRRLDIADLDIDRGDDDDSEDDDYSDNNDDEMDGSVYENVFDSFFERCCREHYNKLYLNPRMKIGVISALSSLTDEEWEIAERDILKSIFTSYGRKKDEIWDQDEHIGLAGLAPVN